MRLLPRLVTPEGQLGLPLADVAAGSLIAMLLTPEPDARRGHAGEALRGDPSLAVWALCRAAQQGRHDVCTVADLAEWLADAALAEWHVDDAQPVQPQPIDLDRTGRWAALAATSLGAAELAAQLATQPTAASRVEPERAYLAGLVHAAGEWLASGVGSAAAGRRARMLLPDWLAGDPPPLDNDAAPPQSVAGCVAWARRAMADGAGAVTESLGIALDAAAHQTRVAQARESWSAANGAGEQLFWLLARLTQLERLEHDFQQALESEKLVALKELAYGAGHEINNPLANISARAQTLLEDERDPERRRKLAAINTQAFRAHEMIADMMLFARPPRPTLAAVEVSKLLARLVEELAPAAAEQGTELVFHAPAGAARLLVAADKTQLAVAVRALCVNALEALVTGGRVELALECQPGNAAANSRAPGETVQITVADDGPGISPEVRRHMFDPFYSGREAGRGLGFGLSKCWRIVSMHGGQIDVASTPGRGTALSILLPAYAGP